MNVAIVAIAKWEQQYIEEWVKWHLSLGFDHIYLYDNEDVPTYGDLLKSYTNVSVIHLPGNTYNKGVQYVALDKFTQGIMRQDKLTHVAHIDIDEFIILKKHNTIQEFIKQFFVGDCRGIGMNWKFFGDSGHTTNSKEPVLLRFTKCQGIGNRHIKTLFSVNEFLQYGTCHDVKLKATFHVKNTKGNIITGPFNTKIDFEYIQLNHYKVKSYEEFAQVRQRGTASLNKESQPKEDIVSSFKRHNFNDEIDTTAAEKYRNLLSNS